MTKLGTFIWNLSEQTGVPLGRLAPTVFGWMVGSKPVAKEATNE